MILLHTFSIQNNSMDTMEPQSSLVRDILVIETLFSLVKLVAYNIPGFRRHSFFSRHHITEEHIYFKRKF
jgi:hypothetical protein